MKKYKLGFTCSAFDLLHPGHILMLKDCKNHCDRLVVGLQTDPTINRKSKNKPIQTLEERLIMISSIKYVDDVLIYSTEKDLRLLLTNLKPDIRILGSDWKDKEDEITSFHIAPIYYHERNHNYSTTNLRKKLNL